MKKKSRALLHLIAFQNLSKTEKRGWELQIVYILKKKISTEYWGTFLIKLQNIVKSNNKKVLMITNLMFVMFFIIDELYHDLFLKADKNKRITVRLIRFHRGKTLCFPLFWLNVCIKATKEKILSSI